MRPRDDGVLPIVSQVSEDMTSILMMIRKSSLAKNPALSSSVDDEQTFNLRLATMIQTKPFCGLGHGAAAEDNFCFLLYQSRDSPNEPVY